MIANQLLFSQFSVSQFFYPKREIHSSLLDVKSGRNGNANLVVFLLNSHVFFFSFNGQNLLT